MVSSMLLKLHRKGRYDFIDHTNEELANKFKHKLSTRQISKYVNRLNKKIFTIEGKTSARVISFSWEYLQNSDRINQDLLRSCLGTTWELPPSNQPPIERFQGPSVSGSVSDPVSEKDILFLGSNNISKKFQEKKLELISEEVEEVKTVKVEE